MMSNRQSVAANTVVRSIFADEDEEIVKFPCVIQAFATAAAVGLNLTLLVGGETVVDDQEVNAQNRMPISPDDQVHESGAVPGMKITARWRNTTAAAIVGFIIIKQIPV